MDNIGVFEAKQKSASYIFVQNGEQSVTNPVFWKLSYLKSQASLLEEAFRQLNVSTCARVLNLLTPGIEGTYFIFNLALENIGSIIIPLGKAEMDVALKFINDLKIDVILGESDYLNDLFLYIENQGASVQIGSLFVIDTIPSNDHLKMFEKYSKKVWSPFIFDINYGIIAKICLEDSERSYHLSSSFLVGNKLSHNGSSSIAQNKLSIEMKSMKNTLKILTSITGLFFTHVDQKSCGCGNKNPLIKLDKANNGNSLVNKSEYLIWQAKCV